MQTRSLSANNFGITKGRNYDEMENCCITIQAPYILKNTVKNKLKQYILSPKAQTITHSKEKAINHV